MAISTIQTVQVALVMPKGLSRRFVARPRGNASAGRDMAAIAVTGAPLHGGATLAVSAANAVNTELQ